MTVENNKIKVRMELGERVGPCKFEVVWARQLGPNIARLLEIPLNLNYGLHDVVKFDAEQENLVTSLLSRHSKTFGCIVSREITDDETEHQKEIREYLKRFLLKVQFQSPRIFCISAPLNMSDERIDAIVDDSPVSFEVCSSERRRL